eukprot:SAG31_NODE_6_length_43291_cov_191.503496_14_plen_445_part_00
MIAKTSSFESFLLNGVLAVGENRFAAGVASKMAKLGALTKGDSRAEAGSELGSFNYDSPLGREALVQVMTNIKASPEQVPLSVLVSQGLVPDGVSDEAALAVFRARCSTGLRSVRLYNMPLQAMTVSRFLGRLLGLDTELQTVLFDYFANTLDVVRAIAQRAGKTSTMVDIAGQNITMKAEQSIDVAGTGTQAKLYALERDRGLPFKYVHARYSELVSGGITTQATGAFYISKKIGQGGHHSLLYVESSPAAATVQVWRPATGQRLGGMSPFELQAKYTRIEADMMEQQWDAAFTRAGVQCVHGSGCKHGSNCRVGRRHQQFQICTGSVIDVWSRIINSKAFASQNGPSLKVVRCETQDGQRVVGLQIPEGHSQTVIDIVSFQISDNPKLLGLLDRLQERTAKLLFQYVSLCFGQGEQHMIAGAIANMSRQLTPGVIADLDRSW